MKIKIWRSTKNKQWYFRVVARNGKTIAQSEGYKHKGGCENIAYKLGLAISQGHNLSEKTEY